MEVPVERRPRGAGRAPWPIPDELDVVDIDGYPHAYLDAGAGDPVVLVHGSFNDYRSWSLQVPALARTHRVLVPSLRHAYPEPWNGRDGGADVLSHARDLVAWVSRLRVGPVHLVGHSRGGAVALHAVLAEPRCARSLVLADPRGLEPLLPDTPESVAMAGELRANFAALRRSLAEGDPDRAAREFIDALSGAGAWDRRSPELKRAFFDNLATANDSGASPPISCRELARLDCDVLLVTGASSPPRYRAMFAAVRRCRPGIPEPVTVPDAAHAMHRDNSTHFNAALSRFLAGGR